MKIRHHSEKKINSSHSSPLFEYLKKYLALNPAPFHTPGHKGAFHFPFQNCNDIFRCDIADDVAEIRDKIRKSEKIASEIFETRNTFYLVNGSTSGILSMFLSVLEPGDKILIGRNLHKSAVAGLILTGAIPEYIPCRTDKRGIALNIVPDDVEIAIRNNLDSKAVFITSPSYFGVCADVEKIAQICRKYGKILLVDSAWGAHFSFHPELPISVMKLGADLVVQSLHKMTPALSGTSILHICSNQIDTDLVERAKGMVETSSPNLLFYLSIEHAILTMADSGQEIFSRAISRVNLCKEVVNKNIGSICFLENPISDGSGNSFAVDPIRLILFVNREKTGVTGIELARTLAQKYGVMVEMSDPDCLVFIMTGFETENHALRLMEALKKVVREVLDVCNSQDSSMLGKPSFLFANKIPTRRMIPRDAFYSKKQTVNLTESAGFVVADIITPYPPGIPILVPGEEISEDVLEYIKTLQRCGGQVKGIRDEMGQWKVTVVK